MAPGGESQRFGGGLRWEQGRTDVPQDRRVKPQGWGTFRAVPGVVLSIRAMIGSADLIVNLSSMIGIGSKIGSEVSILLEGEREKKFVVI